MTDTDDLLKRLDDAHDLRVQTYSRKPATTRRWSAQLNGGDYEIQWPKLDSVPQDTLFA